MKTKTKMRAPLNFALISWLGLYGLPSAAHESILTATIAAPRHGQPLSSDRLALLGQSQGYQSLYDSMFGAPPTETIRLLGSELSQFVAVFSRPMTASSIRRGQEEFSAWKNRFSTEVCRWQSTAQTGVNCQTLNQEIRFAVSQRNSFSRDLAVQKLSALSETVARLENQKNIFGPGLRDDFISTNESHSFADVIGLSASEFRPRVPDSFYSQSRVPVPDIQARQEVGREFTDVVASKISTVRTKTGQCARFVWNALTNYLGENVRAALGSLRASGQAIIAALHRNPEDATERLKNAHLKVVYSPYHKGPIDFKPGQIIVMGKGVCGHHDKYGHVAVLDEVKDSTIDEFAQYKGRVSKDCAEKAIQNGHAMILAVERTPWQAQL